MANKFQKSVLERLEQDAARQKQNKQQTASPTLPTAAPIKKISPVQTVQNKPETPIMPIPAPDPIKVEPVQQEKTPQSILAEPSKSLQPEARITVVPTAQPAQQTISSEPPALPDIGGYLRPQTQRLAKNKTFYLDADVIDAIKATAQRESVTDSKLANDILRRVLGL